jgi:hypothetical protein
MESDVSYFRRRASEERSAALRARDPQAQQIHLDMAERYEDLVRGIISREQFLGLSIVHD